MQLVRTTFYHKSCFSELCCLLYVYCISTFDDCFAHNASVII